MPKEKEQNKMLPRIYKRNFEDLAMFFFSEGQMFVVPTVKIEQALYNYFRFIKEEDFNIESAKVIFSRMRAEFIDYKHENTKKNIGDTEL